VGGHGRQGLLLHSMVFMIRTEAVTGIPLLLLLISSSGLVTMILCSGMWGNLRQGLLLHGMVFIVIRTANEMGGKVGESQSPPRCLS
jgi:hypothetical protein